MLVPMVLVRKVARPEGALLCAEDLLPDVPCAFHGGSCFPMVLCALPAGSCFSMMPEGLPRRISHASAPAERQPLPHRLALRFIPPAALRLRAPPIHEGHGRPRSVRKSSRLRWKHHLPSCSCSLARRQPHPAQVRQIASQTEVLPRRMRFVAGRGHCSSKSPRARILVLGTSGAHWPARWPRFELTERVAKSHLSGY